MKKLLLALVAASLMCSCAGVQKSKVRYGPLGVAPIRTSVSSAQGDLTKAQASNKAASDRAKSASDRLAELNVLTKDNDKLNRITVELQGDVGALTNSLAETTSLLNTAQIALTTGQTRIDELEQKDIARAEQMNKINDERNAAIGERDAAKTEVRKLKFILCGLALGLIVAIMYALFSFAAFSPPLVWVTAGVSLATTTLLWIYL